MNRILKKLEKRSDLDKQIYADLWELMGPLDDLSKDPVWLNENGNPTASEVNELITKQVFVPLKLGRRYIEWKGLYERFPDKEDWVNTSPEVLFGQMHAKPIVSVRTRNTISYKERSIELEKCLDDTQNKLEVLTHEKSSELIKASIELNKAKSEAKEWKSKYQNALKKCRRLEKKLEDFARGQVLQEV